MGKVGTEGVMQMRSILTTVGTSLLNNARKELGIDQPNDQQLSNYIHHTDKTKASAETNSLSRLLRERDRIVFLKSQTDDGRQCAEALVKYYKNAGYQAESVEVPDLNYTESRFKMRGLRSLVHTLCKQIQEEKRQGREVLVNATGGFKAEIAYATLVGLLFDVPVYYIHEAFSDIIEMPPTPISWDYSLLADYEDFFEWIQKDLRQSAEVDARLRSLPDKIRLLLAEEEGHTLLCPAGEAFYEAFRQKEAEAQSIPLFFSNKARAVYDSADPDTRQRFNKSLRKLRFPDLRRSQSAQVGEGDCLVFPRGRCDERIFYFEDEQGRIMICELARHSDSTYEKLLDKGVRKKDYNDFLQWSEKGSQI